MLRGVTCSYSWGKHHYLPDIWGRSFVPTESQKPAANFKQSKSISRPAE